MAYLMDIDLWILCNIKPNKQKGKNETIVSIFLIRN